MTKFAFVVLLVPSFLFGFGYSGTVMAQQKQKKEDAREATVFAYCMCAKCCGDSNPGGKTATGKDGAKHFDGAAADPKAIPFGKRVYLPGIGEKIVDDTGRRLQEALAQRGELLLCFRVRTHEEVTAFKRTKMQIIVLEDER